MSDHPITVWNAIWNEVKVPFIAWAVDLSQAVMLWVGIAVAHLLQLLVLSFGWSPLIIHWLDKCEEFFVLASVATFLLASATRFVWVLYGRTVNTLKEPL